MSIQKRQRKVFMNLLEMPKGLRVCICLDWLSVLFEEPPISPWPIPMEEGKPQSYDMGDGLVLYYTGKGNQYFRHIYNVYENGEHLASVVAHSRSLKFIKKGICKIDFQNHLLYSVDLWPFYSKLVNKFVLTYSNISRLDICIDGMPHVVDFMNEYQRQGKEGKVVEMIGRSDMIRPNVFDRKEMRYLSFKYAGSKGRKQLSMYEKRQDIERLGKHYISSYWEQNGVGIGCAQVYRFELRLRGDAIKELRNFKIGLLKTADGMASVAKLLCNRFFEFVWLDNERITRCSRIDLIPWEQFEIKAIQKEQKKPRTDLYKTRLSVHLRVKRFYSGNIKIQNVAAWATLQDDIESFDLLVWFRKKFEKEWMPAYAPMAPDADHAEAVSDKIMEMMDEIGAMLPYNESGEAERAGAAFELKENIRKRINKMRKAGRFKKITELLVPLTQVNN